MSERLNDTNSWLLVWRFVNTAWPERGKRGQRRFRTEADATAAWEKRWADDEVKALWLWGPAPLRDNGRPEPRPLIQQGNRAKGITRPE